MDRGVRQFVEQRRIERFRLGEPAPVRYLDPILGPVAAGAGGSFRDGGRVLHPGYDPLTLCQRLPVVARCTVRN